MLGEPSADLKLLHAFLLVAEEKHFGQAAARAFVSVPTISGRIKQLEQRLGKELFVRTSRSVELTAEGERFLPGVREHVSGLDEVWRAISEGSARRQIRVAMNRDIEHPSVLGAMQRLAAIADLEHTLRFDHEQVADLLSGRIDLAVAWSRPSDAADRGLASALLAELPVAMVVSAEDDLAEVEMVTPGDVLGRPVVLFERELAPDAYDSITAWLTRAGPLGPLFDATYPSQAGMFAAMSSREQSITFGNWGRAPASLVEVELHPPLATPVWGVVRLGDVDLLDEFASYVAEF